MDGEMQCRNKSKKVDNAFIRVESSESMHDSVSKVLRAKIRILAKKIEQTRKELNDLAESSMMEHGVLKSEELFRKNEILNRYWDEITNVLGTAAVLRDEESVEGLDAAWKAGRARPVYPFTFCTMRRKLVDVHRYHINTKL